MKMKPLFSKKNLLFAALLGGIALAGTLVFSPFDSNTEPATTFHALIRPVKTTSLKESPTTETRSFPALVQAASETDLAFRVEGPLVAFDVRIGQRLSKGDVIARIDPRDFEINVARLTAAIAEANSNLEAMRAGARAEDIAQLEAQLEADRAQEIEAKTNLDRYEKLVAGQVVSRMSYDRIQTAYRTSKARTEAAEQVLKKAHRGARKEDIEATEAHIRYLKADLDAANHALADTYLKAPFSGFVHRKYVENYENVKENAPIVSLLDFSSVEVHTAVPEDVVIRRSDFAAMSCSFDAYPERRFVATLKEIGRKTDSANQSYPITAYLHLPDDVEVQPGMAATLSIQLKKSGQAVAGFLLPAGAVFVDVDGQSCVWRIDAKTMCVIKTRVRTGALSGNSIRILSGLKAGERVVTAGARFLQDGEQVRLLNDSQERRS